MNNGHKQSLVDNIVNSLTGWSEEDIEEIQSSFMYEYPGTDFCYVSDDIVDGLCRGYKVMFILNLAQKLGRSPNEITEKLIELGRFIT